MDVAALELVVELLLLRHELIDVALVEEQLERIELLDERGQRPLRNLIVQPVAREMLALHQHRNDADDLPVGGRGLRGGGQRASTADEQRRSDNETEGQAVAKIGG